MEYAIILTMLGVVFVYFNNEQQRAVRNAEDLHKYEVMAIMTKVMTGELQPVQLLSLYNGERYYANMKHHMNDNDILPCVITQHKDNTKVHVVWDNGNLGVFKKSDLNIFTNR